jgi:hypothetical protein
LPARAPPIDRIGAARAVVVARLKELLASMPMHRSLGQHHPFFRKDFSMSKCSASSKAARCPGGGIAGANGWQKRLDPQLDGLIEPTDPPKYWPHELEADGYPRTCVKCAPTFRLCYAILVSCLHDYWLSLGDLFRDAGFDDDTPEEWLEVVSLCGKGSLNLWRLDGVFLPCRENAAKAVAYITPPGQRVSADQLGFDNVAALVQAINSLPSGIEVAAQLRAEAEASERHGGQPQEACT